MGTIKSTILSHIKEARNNDTEILTSFFKDEISLKKEDYEDEQEYSTVMEYLVASLCSAKISDLIVILKKVHTPIKITSSLIPQFSDFSVAMYDVPKLLSKHEEGLSSNEEIGRLIWPVPRAKEANSKYGENHRNTAEIINLISSGRGRISLTDFGRFYLSLNPAKQASLIPALWLNAPLFKNYFGSDNGEDILAKDISILSESTRKRRMSNIRAVIDVINKGYYMQDNSLINSISRVVSEVDIEESNKKYLRAMRTKPFMLLAGISGTGKSRIVKQMAFESCPKEGNLRKDEISPGNYCLIEVKPNWHDSSELLGYESRIGGANYVLTPFVKFLAKAMLYPDVPFFVCLDEMNLAPVEQYFAEFLSVLESRKKVEGKVVSEPLIKADIFSNPEYRLKLKENLFELEISKHLDKRSGVEFIEAQNSDTKDNAYAVLEKYGLRIPENIIVIGTVNMDETTHQFSRKVIDRAMTIEMNLPEGDPFMDFYNEKSKLEYREEPVSSELFISKEVHASEVLKILSKENYEETETLKQNVAAFLTSLNEVLASTPFQVAYRVQNELILYFYQLWVFDKDGDWTSKLVDACDQILMMKVLPRIEGDEELLKTALEKLIVLCEPYKEATKKLQFMNDRLDKSRFTSFWP